MEHKKIYPDERKIEVLLLLKNYNFSYKRVHEETGISIHAIRTWAESPLAEKVLGPDKKRIKILERKIEHQKNLAEKNMNDFYLKAYETRTKLMDKINCLIDECKDPFALKYLVSALKVVDNILTGNKEEGDGPQKTNKTWITNIMQNIDKQVLQINDKKDNT